MIGHRVRINKSGSTYLLCNLEISLDEGREQMWARVVEGAASSVKWFIAIDSLDELSQAD